MTIKLREHTFHDKNQVAKEFSGRLIRYMEEDLGITVRDVENVRHFQSKDIDFILEKNGVKKTLELKADTYAPNNFYIETVSNANKGTLGCMLYTEADYVLYAFINHNVYYLIHTKKFQEWFKKNRERFKEPNTLPFTPVGDSGYVSKAKLVPVKIMERELKLKATYFDF